MELSQKFLIRVHERGRAEQTQNIRSTSAANRGMFFLCSAAGCVSGVADSLSPRCPTRETPMRTYLVSYDLTAVASAPAIVEEIMQLGQAWARPLDNVWYLRAEQTPAEIEASLSRHLRGEDGLVIQEARGAAALLNTSLRWFRPRRRQDDEAAAVSNVVPFPAAVTASAEMEEVQDELPLLRAAS
jgi:hypothetical protein